MADISTEIAAIESAARGEAVRDAIVSALEAINEEDEETATHTTDGLMSSEDKVKLDGIPDPEATDSGKYLRVNSSGEWVLATVPNAEGVSF